MLRVGSIDYLDALPSGSTTVRPVVGAHVVVRRSILRIGPLIRVLGLLAHEFQIAVVGALRIAAHAFLQRRLALQSAFRMVGWTAVRLGYRRGKAVGRNHLCGSDGSTEQQTRY